MSSTVNYTQHDAVALIALSLPAPLILGGCEPLDEPQQEQSAAPVPILSLWGKGSLIATDRVYSWSESSREDQLATTARFVRSLEADPMAKLSMVAAISNVLIKNQPDPITAGHAGCIGHAAVGRWSADKASSAGMGGEGMWAIEADQLRIYEASFEFRADGTGAERASRSRTVSWLTTG